MRRILCLLLCAALMIACASPVYANDAGEEAPVYGYLPVTIEITDVQTQYLFVMYDNGCVYAMADDLAELLGYTVHSGSGITVTLKNEDTANIPKGIFQFSMNSTDLERDYAYRLEWLKGYTAPCKPIQNELGIWLPLEYTVRLTGGELLILGESAVIVPAYQNVEWVIEQVAEKGTYFQFDFGDDFGYSDSQIEKLCDASTIVNLFSGCLSLDGASWVATTQQLWGSSSAMDSKYGKTLALLMCGCSSGELDSMIDAYSMIGSTAAKDGMVSEILKQVDGANMRNIQQYLTQINEIIQEKSISDAANSKTWKQLQRSVQFLNASDSLQDLFEENSYFSESMEGLSKILRLAGNLSEFYTQDAYSVQAFSEYLQRSGKEDWMPATTHTTMWLTTDTFLENPLLYSVPQLIMDELESVIQDGIKETLGLPANMAMVAWDIGTKTIPWLSEGLEDTEQFQLAMYATILQADAFLTYQELLAQALEGDITASEMSEVSRSCYVYLKSCYVAREAAIAALEGGKESADVKSVIKQQKAINKEIAALLAILKLSDGENSGGYPYGFLPENNEDYLDAAKEDNIAALILAEPYFSYQQIVQQMQQRHGSANILYPYGSYGMNSLGGLCYVNTVDFDKDGLDELIIAYKTNSNPEYFEWQAEIYTYDIAERCAKRVFKNETAYGGGVGGNHIMLTEYQDAVYFVSGHNIGYGIDYSYYGFRDGVFTDVRHVGYREEGYGMYVYDYIYVINGQDVSASVFTEEESQWQSNCTTFYFAKNISQESIDAIRESIACLEKKIHLYADIS